MKCRILIRLVGEYARNEFFCEWYPTEFRCYLKHFDTKPMAWNLVLFPVDSTLKSFQINTFQKRLVIQTPNK